MSKPYQVAFNSLAQAQAFIASVDCKLSVEEKQIYIQKKIDLLPIHQGEVVGLRVDVCLENLETGETKWVDTTVVHTTCANYRVKELVTIAKRNLTEAVGDMHALPKAWNQDPVPTLLERQSEKCAKYGRLVMIAAKQHLDGNMPLSPSLHPL